MKRTVDRLRRRLRGKRGMSMGETLVALLLISMLTMCLATGVAFGVREYNRTMARSESYVLASTLTTIIREELASTTEIKQGTGSFSYKSPYFARDYGEKWSQMVRDGSGHLVVRNGATDIPLVSEASYSSSLNLKASLDKLEYDAASKIFNVTLTVTDSKGDPQITRSFSVVPLNTVTVVPAT